MKKTLLALGVVSLFFPFSAFAALSVDPDTGSVADGYLADVRATVEGDGFGGYFTLTSPNAGGSVCQQESTSFYVGPSSGWGDISDWSVPGTYTLTEYDSGDTDCSGSAVNVYTFTLTASVPPAGGSISYSNSFALIVSQITSFATAIIVIVASIIGVAMGLLVFRWGWRTLMNFPGGMGYDSSKGSGVSRFMPRQKTRSASGSINLLG